MHWIKTNYNQILIPFLLFSKRAAAAFDKTSKGDAVDDDDDDDEYCFDDDANWLSNSIMLLLIFCIYSMHILIQCTS